MKATVRGERVERSAWKCWERKKVLACLADVGTPRERKWVSEEDNVVLRLVEGRKGPPGCGERRAQCWELCPRSA